MSKKFTDAEDEILIYQVCEYPCIYDHENKDFKDYQIRENVWKEIAVILSKNPEECKIRWKNIRDNYFKNKRKQKLGTGSAASSRPTKWTLLELLKFLELVKTERRRLQNFDESQNDNNLQSQTFDDNTTDSELQIDNEIDDVASPESIDLNIPAKRSKPNMSTSRSNTPSSKSNTPSLSGRFVKSTTAKSKLLQNLEEMSKERMEIYSKLVDNQNEDEVDLFMRSMALMSSASTLNEILSQQRQMVLQYIINCAMLMDCS
ncbi:uncharacterized protein LOC126737593 [Anthonomus grandis grandis]|uniref:uncharacterized protein LOC126737593 n=1 Tax=Anthonomus grandis grandis TaxID=2921223 RepID=UPI0021662CCD|nr:uncharacterized protein LOC126737593 [Anthonomus grandis grandis]